MDMLSTTNERKNDDVGWRRAQTVDCQVGARGTDNTQWVFTAGQFAIYLGQAVSTQVQFSFPQVRQRGGERPRVAVDALVRCNKYKKKRLDVMWWVKFLITTNRIEIEPIEVRKKKQKDCQHFQLRLRIPAWPPVDMFPMWGSRRWGNIEDLMIQ